MIKATSGHRRNQEESIFVNKAANGYIVRTPDAWGPRHPIFPLNNDRNLLTPRNIKKIAEIVFMVKDGKHVPDQLLEDEPDPVIEEFDTPTPENNVHIFGTWKEASDFIERYYSQE